MHWTKGVYIFACGLGAGLLFSYYEWLWHWSMVLTASVFVVGLGTFLGWSFPPPLWLIEQFPSLAQRTAVVIDQNELNDEIAKYRPQIPEEFPQS